MRLPIVISVAWLLAACASTARVEVTPQVVKLRQGGSIAIASPGYAVIEKRADFESARETVQTLRTAFEVHSNAVSTYKECSDLSCLKRRAGSSVDYFVVPQILHW